MSLGAWTHDLLFSCVEFLKLNHIQSLLFDVRLAGYNSWRHFTYPPQTNEVMWFTELRKVMLELIDLRRQVLSGQLTQEPAREVKIQITNHIDWGNQRMGLDLVPSVDGKIVDTTNCSIVDLHQVVSEQWVVQDRIKAEAPQKKYPVSGHSSKSVRWCAFLFLICPAVKNVIHVYSVIGARPSFLYTKYDG